jgi:unsaturated chondroitin disaccharide hydrolase
MMRMELSAVLDKSLKKVEHMERLLKDFPHITKDGKWLTHEHGHWTGGFWTGLLWIKSLYSDAPEAEKQNALQWAKRLKARENDNKTHDMGFLFGPSCVMGYKITGDEELARLALAGARNMMDLYEKRSGLVLAWDEPGYEGNAIVDTIMNVPLLIWAAEHTKRPELAELACNLADTILKHHVREDGSIYHLVRWDLDTFEIVERTTHQGFSSETCWSRGLSWALHGFAKMYSCTGKQHYLDASEKLAAYFWNHLDEWWFLPRWDFVFQNREDEPFDAAAGSIAASGMLLLSEQLARAGRTEESALWYERGTLLVKSLTMHCLYQSLDKYGIIEKATVDKPRNSGINESTMYGDYYYTEAVYRLLNRNNNSFIDLLY